MREGLLSGWAGLRIVGEKILDEQLGVVRDGLPTAVIEVEGALTHLLHDVLVALAVEGRHAGEEDVSDDTGGPDIAFVVIVLIKNLWGDVVRSSELLVQVSLGIVYERGAEINDLDLVELLVLLEEDVLGLQVTMDDVGLVAVVDAREHLLHEDGSVTLGEFSALQDFIEELSTLADSVLK